jgi:transcriptional regulator with XRE-family HTH domain
MAWFAKDDGLRADLASRVYRRRRHIGLTQAEVADLCGISGETVSRYERGTACPSVDRIPKLCKALGVTPNELFGWPVKEEV